MGDELSNKGEAKPPVGPRSIPGAIVGSAVQALWCALFFMIFAEIALAVSSEIFQEMVPSLPPGVESGSQEVEPIAQSTFGGWLGGFYDEYKYWIYYGLSFIGLVAINVSAVLKKKPSSMVPAPLRQVGAKIAENWFKILVMNAFGCFFAALIFVILQNISFVRIVVEVVLTALQPAIYRVANIFMNAEAIATAADFIAWFHDNEVKFVFWAFYLTAVLDDLGLPNVKTLARRIYWRFTKTSPTQEQELPKSEC